MEYFNNELFKEKSKVTYVHVKGHIVSSQPKEGIKANSNTYEGYIEVPYCYLDFIRFNKEQQRAICQAAFCKNGICFNFTYGYEPDPDMFYLE